MRVSVVLRSKRRCRCARVPPSMRLLRFLCRHRLPLPISQRSHRIVESGHRLLHLLARSDGDAHAAVAAGIAGAVAHQHARRAHQAHKLRMLRADLDEDEICAAGPAANSGCIERGFKLRARGKHFADVPVEIGRVFKRRRQAGQRQRVHAVGRKHAANPAHQFDRPGQQAEAQTGESVGFRKCARHDEIRHGADQIHDRLAVEMEVSFIDQQHRMRRALRKFQQLRARGHGAGRAVGIGDRR